MLWVLLSLCISQVFAQCVDDPAGVLANDNSTCALYATFIEDCTYNNTLDLCPVYCLTCTCDAVTHCNGQGTSTDINYIDGCDCVCTGGYSGSDCTIPPICNAATDCSGNGATTDTVTSDGCDCTCDPGYGGQNCSIVASTVAPGCTEITDDASATCTAVSCDSTMLDQNSDPSDGCEISYDNECYFPVTGTDEYDGNVWTTKTGKSCIQWSTVCVPSVSCPNDGDSTHQLCQFAGFAQPWCFWGTGATEFEDCDIPACACANINIPNAVCDTCDLTTQTCNSLTCDGDYRNDNGNVMDGCEIADPTMFPTLAPSTSIPSELPSLAPSCFGTDHNQLGSAALAIDSSSAMDSESFTLVLNIPDHYDVMSVTFPSVGTAEYSAGTPGIWTENAATCITQLTADLDMTTFYAITTFSNDTNQFCTTMEVELSETNGVTRTISYEMPWCVQLASSVSLSTSIDVEVDEPNLIYVSRIIAYTHPDEHTGQATVEATWTTQVVFPYTVDTSFTWVDSSNVVASTDTLQELNNECTTRDYCWQTWQLTFRVNSVCVNRWDMVITQTAMYDQFNVPFTITSELYTEAACAVVIDDLHTPLTGSLEISLDPTFTTTDNRYHINDTVYARMTVADFKAPITALTVDSLTLEQNSNSMAMTHTNVSSSGEVSVISFELRAPVLGSIAGVFTVLTMDILITYGSGTVRRRRLQEKVTPDALSKSTQFLILENSCTAPDRAAGELIESECIADSTIQYRICENGQWNKLNECPEVTEESPPGIVEEEDNLTSTSGTSPENSFWEIIFFSLIAVVAVGLGVFLHYLCCRAPATKQASPGIQAHV